MEIKGIKRESLSKQVSDQLETMIEHGEFKVGEKIPTETDLMELFAVSRNTIREAIRALTWNGILDVRQGDGTYVKSSSRFQANMNQRYDEASIEDIREARKCIEVTIAHLAAIRRNEEDLKKLTIAFQCRQDLKEDIKENTRADLEFHKTIAQACHNIILMDLYESFSIYLENHIENANNNPMVDQMHEELYEAIKDQDENRAVLAAQNIVNL